MLHATSAKERIHAHSSAVKPTGVVNGKERREVESARRLFLLTVLLAYSHSSSVRNELLIACSREGVSRGCTVVASASRF